MKNEILEKEAMIDKEIQRQFLKDQAVKEMQKYKRLTKETFKGLMNLYDVKQAEISYYYKTIQQEECDKCDKCGEENCRECLYNKNWNSNQISNMIREKSERKPTKEFSIIFLKYSPVYNFLEK